MRMADKFVQIFFEKTTRFLKKQLSLDDYSFFQISVPFLQIVWTRNMAAKRDFNFWVGSSNNNETRMRRHVFLELWLVVLA